jgi:hypothetical protein
MELVRISTWKRAAIESLLLSVAPQGMTITRQEMQRAIA